MCLPAVNAAFCTSKWTVTSEDPSLKDAPEWSSQDHCLPLSQTAALMVSILHCGSNKAQQSDASSTTHGTQTPMWPAPSSKEWASISTVVNRVTAVLEWLHGRLAEAAEPSSGIADMLTDPEHIEKQHCFRYLLMRMLLQLLDALLTRKLFVRNVRSHSSCCVLQRLCSRGNAVQTCCVMFQLFLQQQDSNAAHAET